MDSQKTNMTGPYPDPISQVLEFQVSIGFVEELVFLFMLCA